MALALSGGGDSVALLAVAADWARRRGRLLLALTVDHRLNPMSQEWTERAGRMACDAGVDWRGLVWDRPAGGAGVQARARAARHGLIAEAARDAGARVILFAHTADDITEADWMRARGSTLGRLKEWSPSPAWPEGRGLMLLRPLLNERRGDLRQWLAGRGLDWIDDPANEDQRFMRSRARAELAKMEASEGALAASRFDDDGAAATLDWSGMATLRRTSKARTLAAVLLCVGGGATPPRGDRLEALAKRLAAGEDFTAGLAGARVQATGDRVQIMREPGDLRRRPPDALMLGDRETGVWDGRFEITANSGGGRVVAAQGLLSRLSPDDRRIVASLPPAARAALPVLVRGNGDAPVLAWRGAKVWSLGPRRLALALGETTQESDLFDALHGETPPSDLFSLKDFPVDAPPMA